MSDTSVDPLRDSWKTNPVGLFSAGSCATVDSATALVFSSVQCFSTRSSKSGVSGGLDAYMSNGTRQSLTTGLFLLVMAPISNCRMGQSVVG